MTGSCSEFSPRHLTSACSGGQRRLMVRSAADLGIRRVLCTRRAQAPAAEARFDRRRAVQVRRPLTIGDSLHVDAAPYHRPHRC